MNPVQAEDGLKELLREAGVDPASPGPFATWRVFARFGAEALDGIAPDDDGFLFEWGVYDDDRFYLGFLRQFSFYTPDGEYDHMEQLRCTFHFEPTPDLRALGKGHDWWFRSEPQRTLIDWIAQVEALPVFGVLRNGLQPTDAFIEQGRV